MGRSDDKAGAENAKTDRQPLTSEKGNPGEEQELGGQGAVMDVLR